MILRVDTTENNHIKLALKKDGNIIAEKRIKTDFDQAKKILPAISKILKDNKMKLEDVSGIETANKGGSFTSLRIGVVTANALGYALGVPVKGESGEGKHESGFNIIDFINFIQR